MSVHRDLTGVQIHVPYAWAYADATARAAATGFASSDVGKLARQTDDNSLWMLTDDSPVTWVQAGGSGGSSTLDGLSDVTITTPSTGEVLTYNGSWWVNDTASGGTEITQSTTAPATPATGDLWLDTDGTSSYLSGGTMLVAETTVAADTTSVSFTGLDGNAHGGYMLDFSVINANGSSATDMYLHVNGDTTVTNYYCEYNLISGSTNIVGNANTSAVASAPISDKCQGYTVVRCDNSRFNYMSFLTSHTTTNTRIFNIYGNKTADISNIASLTITASNASAIAIGSIFRLYRRK